jgi:hypothetical protein
MSLERMPPDLLLWLQERVIERDGCWIWQRYAKGGSPQADIGGRVQLVRRYVYNATHVALTAKRVASMRCDSPLCVHPDHIAGRTRSEVHRGKPKPHGHGVKIAKARRAVSKVTGDDVAAIRESDETGQALAKRYGVSRSCISTIRLHKVWRELSSPFAGLGGRA